MQDIVLEYYLWIKALHIIAVISWMAGLFYLPRLFVYHCESEKNSDKAQTFIIMERKLLKIIMNPAMVLTWVFGIFLMVANPQIFDGAWMTVKLLAVMAMSAFHMILAKWRRDFERGEHPFNARFFRQVNEIPTLLMIVIVVMVIVRPF